MTDYYRQRSARDGHTPRCKDCARLKDQTPRRKAAQAVWKKAWQQANPDKIAKYHRKRAYQITQEEFEAMIEAQRGACGICGRTDVERFSVDHCHKTGKVRGLLCSPCNGALGSFKDDIGTLEAAIKYLKLHQEQ